MAEPLETVLFLLTVIFGGVPLHRMTFITYILYLHRIKLCGYCSVHFHSVPQVVMGSGGTGTKG